MPKRLSDYGPADWLHLRPLQHRLKAARYRLIRSLYLRREARRLPDADLWQRVAGRRLLVTIAFDDPDIIAVQIAAIRTCIADVVHVIADNSRQEGHAAAIEALCAKARIDYIRLPQNPWSRSAPSRSHGLALDWVWQRLVLPCGPAVFGFLDHDIIPLEPCDPFEPLARQPIHGDKRWAGDRWFLWAGYCFFRTSFLRGKAVDFGQDWFVGLDTGGANWRSLYAHLDPASLEDRPITRIPVAADVPVTEAYIERRGVWLHEVGLDGHLADRALKRQRMLALVTRTAPDIPRGDR